MPHSNKDKGSLFVISGPSGVGKGTLVKRIADQDDNIWVSISATTRSPRVGEVDGVNYFFLSKDEFLRMINEGGFIEWAEYEGNYYGTPIGSILERLNEGKNVILEIEVQGAMQVKDKIPDAKLVFIEPPSIDELENRLRERGTETDGAIESRINTAKLELLQKMEYDIRLTNDDLEQATSDLLSIVSTK